MSQHTSALPQEKCPYVGLVPFTEADKDFFFGRDQEQQVIAANLMASRLTLLYGASGVGKSSVLHAGVMPHLRSLAAENRELLGRPELAAVVFSTWSNDPSTGLHHAIAEAVQRSRPQSSHLAPRDEGGAANDPSTNESRGSLREPTLDRGAIHDTHSLPKIIEHWSQQLDGELLIILDQFEEFFLYHGREDGPGTFFHEFPRAVNRADLRVSFLVSIREDALAKLDAFKGRIPNLFDNYLRIEHLDREAARQAIEKPLEKFNARLAEHDQGKKIDLDPALIDAVLDQVQTGQTRIGQVGRGGVESEPAEDRRIEAPYLQLVLTRLWDEEHLAGSHQLRRATLDRLGGAKQIVRTHLDLVMQRFEDDQRRIVARVFDRLVTPSGTKIAMSAADLASLAHVSAEQLQPVLEQLAGPKLRILRAVPPPLDQPDQPRFEIFHDVLAASILDWQTRYTTERRLRRAFGLTAAALFLVALLTSLTVFAVRMARQAEQAEFQAKESLARTHIDRGITNIRDGKLAEGITRLAAAHYFSPPGAIRDSSRNLLGGWCSRLGFPMRHEAAVVIVAFSPNGATVLTGSVDNTARLWDARTGAPQGKPLRHESTVLAVAFSPDGASVLTGSVDNTARLWDAPMGEPLRHGSSVLAVAVSPDGATLLTGSRDNTARLWDARTGAPLGEPLQHKAEVGAVAFSPGGATVLTGSADNTARLWDAQTGAPRGGPLRHEALVLAVAFSPDGATVLTGSGDVDISEGEARLWDARTGAPRGEPLQHKAVVRAVAFSPDGATVLTGSDDNTARLWDAQTGAPRGRPLRHEALVLAVAFSPDGATLLTGSGDVDISTGEARLWDARTGAPRGEPLRHPSVVLAVAFSPDGATMLTGDWGYAARLWDVRTDAPRGEPLRHEDATVKAVAFSPDGTKVLTASESGARLWDVPPPALDDSERLKLSVEVRTTWTYDEQGLLRRLTQAEWLERWERLDALGGPCDVVTWDQYRAFEKSKRRAQ